MNRFSRFVQLVVCVSAIASGALANEAPQLDIEFGFNSKPPLFFFENGKAVGDVVEVVRQACTLAGLKCGFVDLPFQRAMLFLENQRPGFAALGFSKTPEREKFVKFSEPVWLDASPVLLVRAADESAFRQYSSLADLVNRSPYVFGGKSGNVYPIDAQLRGLGTRDRRFSAEANRFPLLLISNRFDFMLMYPAEISLALQASGVLPSAVTVVTYPDMPSGAERFLLFSKNTEPEILKKVNAALKELRKKGKIATLN